MGGFNFGERKAKALSAIADREGTRQRSGTKLLYPSMLSYLIEIYVGKTDDRIDKLAAGNVSRWQPKEATGTAQITATTDMEDSTDNDQVFNLFADVGSDKWCIYIRIFYSFFMISAEC